MRLLSLVNTLLDFSRIEAGRARANYEPTDLAAVTADLASNFRSVMEKTGLTLRIDCPPLPEPIYVDRDMWEKIVLNLLSNAFKFTFEGEIAVYLSATADGRAVEMTVRDTGVGIPSAELPRMFERFHRIENQKGRSFEGSGIGLALVQELVKLHGGSIRVDSEAGQGTAFIVLVPRGAAHLPVDHESVRSGASTTLLSPAFVEEAQRWLPGNAETSSPTILDGMSSGVQQLDQETAAGSRPRVLVADDNSDMRAYLYRLLRGRFDVEVVADGEAALAAAQANPPHLFLADVMMPRLDGFGLLRAIRADSRLRELPVILLSARAGEEAKIEGLDAGADDYLVKPFSARELVARVQANLKMAQIRKAAEDALRKRTIELETVLDTVPAAVWFTHDRDAERVTGNRHASNLLSIPIESKASLTAPESERPTYRAFRNGEEAAADTLPIQRAARGEDAPEEELEIRFDDGSVTTILTGAASLRDASGQIGGAVCVALDVTERKRAEEALRESGARQAFMLSLGDSLRELDDPRAVMATAAEALGRRFGVSRAGYGEIEPDGEHILFETCWTDGAVDPIIGVFPLASFGPGNMAELAQGLTTTYEADPRTAGADFVAIEARAAMAVPLVRGGRLRAALYLNHREIRPWLAHEVSVIEETATRTWAAVERARAEDALAQHNRHLKLLTKIIGDLLLQGDAQGLLRQAFDAVSAQVGADLYFHYELKEDDGDPLRLANSGGLDEVTKAKFAEIPVGRFLCGRVARERRPLILSGLLGDTTEETSGVRGLGVRCYAGFPLIAQGRLLGTIAFCSTTTGAFAPLDIELMATVSSQLAAAIVRASLNADLRESENRFRAIAENIPQLAWIADREGNVDWFNRGWLEYTGTTLQDNLGVGWKAVHHPDHVDVVAEKFERHLREGLDWEDTFPLRGKDGVYRWFLSRMNAIHDESGEVLRFFGTNTDITERLRTDEQRTLLINELNHRVKNTLATVQSLAMQTMRNSGGNADAHQLFEARLAALSRAHDMLTDESWEGADLRDVVDRALAPFRTTEQRLIVEGPVVRLSPKQALALSMALHELATNAVKYGALSNDAGQVRIAWSIAPLDGLGELQLTWTEEGGPTVAPPKRRGFGSRLIERNLAHDLGGDASIEYRSEGVVSIIKSPLEPAGGDMIAFRSMQ